MAQRSEKEELQRMRKVASSIAKEVKHFWESVRKVYTTSKMCVCVCVSTEQNVDFDCVCDMCTVPQWVK